VLAEVAAGRERPRLVTLAVEPLPPDLVESQGPTVAGCGALLERLVARHRLHGARAVVVLEPARAVCRFWAAPALSEADRLGCLAFEAEKWGQTSATDLWLGTLARLTPSEGGAPGVLPQREDENSLALVAPAEAVVPLLRAIAAAGLEPWGVSVPPLAIEGLLSRVGEGPAVPEAGGSGAGGPGIGGPATGKVEVAIHFGAERSWLAVCRDDRLLMVRDLDLARDGLLSALAQVSVEGQGNVRLSADEAALVLDRCGVVFEDDPFGMATDRIPLESLKYALRPVLERLASTINRSLDFCREQFFIEIPDTIALTGEGALIPSFDEFLSAHVMARVRRGLAWQGRLDAPDANAALWDEHPGLAAIAVGAALGALAGRALPSRAAAFGLARWITLPIRRVLAVTAAALIAGALLIGARGEQLATRHGGDSAQLAALRTQIAAAQERYHLLEATLLERQLVTDFYRDNIRVDGILKVLSRSVGPDVTLTELDLPALNAGLFDRGGAPATGAAEAGRASGAATGGAGPAASREEGMVSLSGLARTDRERVETCLSRLIVRLEQAPYFENVTFVQSAEAGERSASFQLRCRIRQGLRQEPRAKVVAGR
jgi:Tfp pilus assembly PilM family ATPase